MHDRVRGERLADALRADRPAAERDHLRAAVPEQLEHHLFLARAEGGLALTVEVRLDRLAEAVLDDAVGVDRLRAELGGERTGAARLARAHEADEDERVYAAPLHPMRSL